MPEKFIPRALGDDTNLSQVITQALRQLDGSR